MTNTNMLKKKIEESGYKLRFIAAKVGLSYQGFLNKMTNKSEFRAGEIQTLCALLDIDVAEKEKIFFATCVDNLSTHYIAAHEAEQK